MARSPLTPHDSMPGSPICKHSLVHHAPGQHGGGDRPPGSTHPAQDGVQQAGAAAATAVAGDALEEVEERGLGVARGGVSGRATG